MPTEYLSKLLTTCFRSQSSQFSTTGSETNVIKGAVKEVTYLADLEAVEIAHSMPDGKISKISMAVTKTGNTSECGIPATGDKRS